MVLSWADAHRVANIAAAQAHHDLYVDAAAPPIDVAAALAADGVLLMWRPMPRLFGAYLNSRDARPGVLVNSAIPVGARRHTAAHELGHHRLRHSAIVDDGACLHLDPLETEAGYPPANRARWTDQEKTAEAFAAWFLMPRRAVLAAMNRLGLAQVHTATEVYLLSLLLGTSYRSTARHLPNLRLASQARSRSWLSEVPGRLKARLDPTGTWQGRGTSDVWPVDSRFDGSGVTLQPGDQLVATAGPGQHLVVAGDDCLTELASSAKSSDFPSPDSTILHGEATRRSWHATPPPVTADQAATASLATVTAVDRPGEAVDTSWTVSVLVAAPPLGLDTSAPPPRREHNR